MQRDEARFQAQRAEASSEFMSVMLEEVGAPNKPLTPIQLLDKGVELLDRQYGGDPRFAAQMYLQMSNRFGDLGSSERRTQLLARAATIARDVGDDALVASIECTLARAESQDNRLDQASVHLQNGYAALKRLATPPHTATVDCLRGEIELADQSGKAQEALRLLEKARLELEAANDIRGLQYHAVLTDIAGIYYKLGRFKDALTLNASTSEMLDRNGRGGTMARAIVAGNRATLLAVLGETRRAESAGLDAARRVEALRSDRDAIPGMAIRYATTLSRLRRTNEAIRILTDAHRESVALGNKYWTGQASYRLGMAYAIGGRPELAMPHIEAARRLWTENPRAYTDDLAELSRAMAEMALERGDTADAKSLIDRALEQYGYPGDTSRPGTAAALITGVRVYLAVGDKETAFSLATAALRVTEGIARDPKESADVGEAQLVMAMTQKARGNRAETQLAAKHAVEALTNALGETHPLTRSAKTLQRSVAT